MKRGSRQRGATIAPRSRKTRAIGHGPRVARVRGHEALLDPFRLGRSRRRLLRRARQHAGDEVLHSVRWRPNVLAHRWLFPPLAALSLLIELGAPLAILHRRVALVWALCAWGFHLGVLLLMAILFPYQLSGVAYASLFPLERAVARLRRTAGSARIR